MPLNVPNQTKIILPDFSIGQLVVKVKFPFFAQFQVDHLSQPVVPTLVLLLCKFTGFVYSLSPHNLHLLFYGVIIWLFWKFFSVALAEGFPLESEWQISRILFSILADVNNTPV